MESRRFVLVQKWLGGQPLAREDILLWVFDRLIGDQGKLRKGSTFLHFCKVNLRWLKTPHHGPCRLLVLELFLLPLSLNVDIAEIYGCM